MSGFFADIELSGWKEFEDVVEPRRFFRALSRAVDKTSGRMLMLAKQALKKNMKNSRLWAKNAEWTLREKKGSKPLIDKGDLIGSVGGEKIKKSKFSGDSFLGGFIVGVNKTKGKYNIAEILHEGAILKNPKSGKSMILPARPFLKFTLEDHGFKSRLETHLEYAVNLAFLSYMNPRPQKQQTSFNQGGTVLYNSNSVTAKIS